MHIVPVTAETGYRHPVSSQSAQHVLRPSDLSGIVGGHWVKILFPMCPVAPWNSKRHWNSERDLFLKDNVWVPDFNVQCLGKAE